MTPHGVLAAGIRALMRTEVAGYYSRVERILIGCDTRKEVFGFKEDMSELLRKVVHKYL